MNNQRSIIIDAGGKQNVIICFHDLKQTFFLLLLISCFMDLTKKTRSKKIIIFITEIYESCKGERRKTNGSKFQGNSIGMKWKKSLRTQRWMNHLFFIKSTRKHFILFISGVILTLLLMLLHWDYFLFSLI